MTASGPWAVSGRKGRTMKHALFTLALAFAISAAPALAQEFKAGDIVIEKPWARATPKGAEVGGGYLTIHNNGATPDRLTGGTADFAAVEIHQMTSKNGVSEMREVESGLAIPAHGSVALSPGGYHLMFKRLTPSPGERRKRQGHAQIRTCRPGRGRVQRHGNWRRRARRHEGHGRHEDVKGLMRSRAQAICFDRERSSRWRGGSALGPCCVDFARA